MNEELTYRIAFSVCPGIGPVRFAALLSRFSTAKDAWHAPEADIRTAGLPEGVIAEYLRFRSGFSPAVYLRRLAAAGISAYSPDDPSYPERLRNIPDPPIVLYVKGTLPDTARAVAVVGTRRLTPYGKDMANRIAEGLARNGVTVVSGMAYGIDAAAHTAAMRAGGKTVAVLGCGVDIAAPAGNYSIYKAITGGHGAIVSEMPLGYRPEKGIFVTRNRIISGMSLGVVIVEAPEKSGALITARYAAEQGRDVFTVPGAVTNPSARGTFMLLTEGAIPVSGVSDILSALHLAEFHGSKNTATTPLSDKILTYLSANGPASIDVLARMAGLTETEAAATLTVLEMDGLVRDTGWKVYAANPC